MALSKQFPWPKESPPLEFNPAGWFPECNKKLLSKHISRNTSVIVELGSWMGLSTRWFTDVAPWASVVAIDHWKGGPENKDDPSLPRLYEQFVANCWNKRSKIIPLRMTTSEGIKVLKDMCIKADLVYVDAGHEYNFVLNDIIDCGPFNCPIVGDDFNPNRWEGVVRGVWEGSVELQRNLHIFESGWVIK